MIVIAFYFTLVKFQLIEKKYFLKLESTCIRKLGNTLLDYMQTLVSYGYALMVNAKSCIKFTHIASLKPEEFGFIMFYDVNESIQKPNCEISLLFHVTYV